MCIKNIYVFLFFVPLLNCVSLSGSPATIYPTTQKRLPCQDNPNPTPVVFSCDEAVKIIQQQNRCKKWPKRCAKMVDNEKERCTIRIKGENKKCDADKKAIEERCELFLKQKTTNISTYLIVGVISALGGGAVATFITVLFFNAK